ncbi:unnamed protein product [Polarella glacialis]|uniref:Rab3 GTPase-activating protein catalytic subunit n=1 Tax=Polarella glacialis TaxID=89957 RepID=A0A813GUB7_POLGL|nr:unnamed protein product [Polarella glacialis]
MNHGPASTVDGLSSDEEDKDLDGDSTTRRGTRPMLEQCSLAELSGELPLEMGPASSPDDAVTPSSGGAGRQEEKEGVFEIRDFTTASSFERISHQISLAAKRWFSALNAAEAQTSGDEGLLRREGFDHMEFRYELLFQIVQQTQQLVPTGASPKEDRLGLHAFPTRAHRLQRMFGVRHFLIVSVRNQNIDIDSARTVLGAAALAVRSCVQSCERPPLSVFVPVDGGRKRYLGELLRGGNRVLYSTDLQTSVNPALEHLAGLSDFFYKKMEIKPLDPSHTLMVGARFTYSADFFEPLASWRHVAQIAERKDADMNGTDQGAGVEVDPVESVKLHCLWPSFPLGSFVDDASFSELDPRAAPYWKVRVLRRDKTPLPLSQRLRALLDFRKEAQTVRSAEHSMQPQMPKTALESLTAAIQESLESILLPTPHEMMLLTEECMNFPIVPDGEATSFLGPLKGARLRDRLTRLAELGATLRCFKGTVVLWCNVLSRMRSQWDALEKPGPGSASPPTRRVGARGVRAELFDGSVCLVQQKMELLQRSVEECRSRLASLPTPSSSSSAPPPAQLRSSSTGESLRVPILLSPALLTEDVVVQRDTAAESINDLAERADSLHGRELRSDIAAFKDANPGAGLEDFLAYREDFEKLSLQPLPKDWLDGLWATVEARSAAEQQAKLFEPEREAEMALHYMENIEGTQLLLQLFRVLLRSTLQELSNRVSSAGGGPAYLRVLRDRAAAASLRAFGVGAQGPGSTSPEEDDLHMDAVATIVGEVAEFPHEEPLQGAMDAIEAFEAATRLACSLRGKMPDQVEALLEELLTDGEADVTDPMQRCALEKVFEKSRLLARAYHETHGGVASSSTIDAQGIFDALPLAKEFVLQLQEKDSELGSCGCRRLYAEVRERHMRLALGRGLQVA